MKFLLDTNFVSESMKPQPNPGVIQWLASIDDDDTFLSVVTITELRYGAEILAVGRKRQQLEHWLENDLALRFEQRLIPVNRLVANACGVLIARSESLGRPIETRDAYIAATAEFYGMTLVTRNRSDFEKIVSEIITPWS
jgi:predicted nucleic acid-binding protein